VLLQEETTVESFPLERPTLQRRRRGATLDVGSLPYFIAGDENRLASLVCRGEIDVFQIGNPVLLTGPVGCGKTSIALHLATRAAMDHVTDANLTDFGQSKNGPAKVVYYSAVDFARSYAEAIGADDLKPLSEELDDAPVLVVDDLHLIANKIAAQEELALRIETRFDAGKPTILTCKRNPAEVRGICNRLASRAAPGLMIPIALPKTESRKQLLGELALHMGLEIDASLISILDAGLESAIPVRAMEAAMKQVQLWCRMNESETSLAAVQAAINGSRQVRDVSVATITNTVARYFSLKSSDLRSSSRKQNLVRARSLAMWLARKLTDTSMNQIGEHFGGRDHTTVLHAVRKTTELVESDTAIRRAAAELTEKLAA
jgi:chromosomal replication initiator protein